ncbi:hypothetical protein TOPH_07266 [Tolypocladium ophioglossoides CBS 100239]|uniref:Centromere protein Cenp-O n=1 Tax=Tolypocladium ophioglossoides (strain CBS 100239) TaxID=1163406 RepID=A0A0L0N2S3_TOLOC|nr:hypothetical protein TOPH_07266 [Tolypocladium ophioglossoides CBS 100239]
MRRIPGGLNKRGVPYLISASAPQPASTASTPDAKVNNAPIPPRRLLFACASPLRTMATAASASEAALLDKEIEHLQAEGKPQHRRRASSPLATLRKTLKVQCSTILSSTSTQRLIQSAASSASSSLIRRPKRTNPSRSKLSSRSTQQHAYTQQCIYRISTPVTAFKIHDPDPNAVDGGHVLGLRFEVMSRGQFLRPYYVMLNRPFPSSTHLRVHRHTIPPAVPLAGLAVRHLPSPRPEGDEQPRQDLERFVRTLRREVTRYHNRLGVSADLRRRLGLHGATEASAPANSVVEVGIADIEAKQIKLAWADESSGRLIMDDDGNVRKLVVFGRRGRDWDMTKELFGKYDRMEDIARRLEERK